MSKDFLYPNEPWQAHAQKAVIASLLMLCNGQYSDPQAFADELSAIAEMISGRPQSLIDFTTDGGVFPEEAA